MKKLFVEVDSVQFIITEKWLKFVDDFFLIGKISNIKKVYVLKIK